MHSLCVFLASKDGTSPAYAKAALELGRAMAEQGIRLVYGAASGGLMGLLAHSVLDNGGEVVGIIPHSLQKQEKPLIGLTELIWVDTIAQRIALMRDFASGFLVMPGGLGTVEELFIVWNEIRLGLSHKPLGILNIDDYYTPLLQFISQMSSQGFVPSSKTQIPVVAKEPQGLLEELFKLSNIKPQGDYER